MKLSHSLLLLFCLLSGPLAAQSVFSSTVSVHARNQPLQDVLTIIGNEANVTFSYNTKSIRPDTLVTVNAVNKPLGEVLRVIFNAGFEFKESGSYIIIRRKPVTTNGVIKKSAANNEYYLVSGVVVDEETGEKIPDATIYEKQHLISSLTDSKGFFTLKLKNKYPNAVITVSKTDYMDTSLAVQTKFNQQVSISLRHREEWKLPEADSMNALVLNAPADTMEENGDRMEKKWIGRVLLSSRQRIQSLNLKRFYTTRAWQFSLIPGLSTHGKLNAQVINKTSINLIGGYSGGVEIMELGGLFNIDKQHVRFLQLAGIFNVVGGNVDGVQASCVMNEVDGNTGGVQVAGLVNIVRKNVRGLQIATLYNQASRVKGVQIGLINVTNSNEGSSIGLINISKGKHHRRIGFILRLPRKASA